MQHIADLFYTIAHDDTGTSRLNSHSLEFGLAAALLAELVHTGRLDINPETERITVLRKDPPVDVLTHKVHDTLMAQREELPLRMWIRYLAMDAVKDVAERLERLGQVEPVKRGFLINRRTVYEPVDANAWEGAYAILRVALQKANIVDWERGWCAALAYATGLTRAMLDGTDTRAFRYLDWIVSRQLPPSGQALIMATSAVISESVYAHR